MKKGAIVTGGARGIGLAISKELVFRGYNVVICSRTKSDCDHALSILNTPTSTTQALVVDISTLRGCKKLIHFAKHTLPSINMLVNNAGIYGPIGPIEENNSKEWKHTIEVNLMSMVYCSQLVIPIMKSQTNGKIINICGGGVGSKKISSRCSAYTTSKYAVAGFTESMAVELRDTNIQINSISPGAVNSQFTTYYLSQGPEKTGQDQYVQVQKQLHEGGTPPELTASMVAFLGSDEANHISGRMISAKWDTVEVLKAQLPEQLYTLRRIDNQLFSEKSL